MSDKTPDDRDLFLRDQSFSELAIADVRTRLAILCDVESPGRAGEEPIREKWEKRARQDLITAAASLDAPRRVALVSSAGRGKSTNMTWVEAHIAGEPDSKQVPFLFRLDSIPGHEEASHIPALENAVKHPNALFDELALRVTLAATGDQARHRWALERYAAAGRITLLFDGLDHVMDRAAFVKNLALLLNAPPWRQCPIWISGRREAFKEWGIAFFGGFPLRVLRVDPLAEPEIGFFLKSKTGHRWHDDFPRECQQLLATPRTLGLIDRVLRTQIPNPPADKQTRQEEIRKLELNTAAGIYRHAYFHVGSNPNALDGHGLLAQGLLADKASFGLEAEEPELENLVDRVERMGLVLGAIAFHMVSQGVEGVTLSALRRDVGPKLEKMGHGTAARFVKDLGLLRRMDNHTLEFSLFNSDLSTGEISWDNRTVRAFFAAYWATRHASFDEDLPKLQRWIIDMDGEPLYGFDEFWQFAAEMPDRALRTGSKMAEADLKRWMHIFGPCYTPPAKLKGKHLWMQWHRRMVYFTFDAMGRRSSHTVLQWRKRTRKQEAIVLEIEAGWKDIAAGPCHYGAEPAENRRGAVIQVPAFRMHQWPVINRWYEAFDPAYRENRWKHEYLYSPHPLASVGREEAEYCPVVNVTWYDAWNFAAWLGDHVFLPSELQWEHACRKGTAWDYYFEGGEKELLSHAWFYDNSDCRMHPMPAADSSRHRNDNGLYDMLGNVWEWCADWYDKDALSRVVRGGSWVNRGGGCRSSFRAGFVPGARVQDYGFRLAAVPCAVGAKSVRSAGDAAASVVEP